MYSENRSNRISWQTVYARKKERSQNDSRFLASIAGRRVSAEIEMEKTVDGESFRGKTV